MARGKRTGRRAGPERRCHGKRRYRNRDDATEGLEKLATARGFYIGNWRAYRCGHCGTWHIGHRQGLGRQQGI